MPQQTTKPHAGSAQDRLFAELMLWPFSAARLALSWWPAGEGGRAARRDETPLPWTTENTGALELPTMTLRDFSCGASGQPVLICAAYALHGAQTADLAPNHSIVQALQQAGVSRIYLTEWRSATPSMRYFAIDNFLADLNVAVDEIGAPVDLVGLCQGGWMSLIYAARFPHKVRRLVLVGAPVDLSVHSGLSRTVANVPREVFAELVELGRGMMTGNQMLGFWSASLQSQNVEKVLQRKLDDDPEAGDRLRERFRCWDETTVDLPGTYYLQVVDWIYKENRIARGRFVALGRKVDLSKVTIPVFLLAGSEDDVVSPEQAFATARLLGTPPDLVERASEPCGHLGLLIGARTLRNSWPRIADWLASDLVSDHAGTRAQA